MPRIVAIKPKSPVVAKKALVSEGDQPSVTLGDLNPLLTCQLCAGYLINAHTLTECSHAFCKSCLYNYSRQMVLSDKPLACPVCGTTQQLFHTVIHGVRPDHLLQSLVYKLVPGLISKEVQRRTEFYNNMQKETKSISLSLEHVDRSVTSILNRSDSPVAPNEQTKSETNSTASSRFSRIYLRCPSQLTVLQMKKFITIRFSLSASSDISLLSSFDEVMHDSLSMAEVAFLLDYKNEDDSAPLRLFFSISEYKTKAKRKMGDAPGESTPPTRPVRRRRPAVVQKKKSTSSSSTTTSSSESSDEDEKSSSSDASSSSKKRNSSRSDSDASSVEGERRETASEFASPPVNQVKPLVTPSSTSYLVSSDPERPKLVLRRVSTQDIQSGLLQLREKPPEEIAKLPDQSSS